MNATLTHRTHNRTTPLFARAPQKILPRGAGFGLVEIVIVVAIVSAVLFAFLEVEWISIKLLRTEKENTQATLLGQETLEAVRALRDQSWANNITPLATDGTRYYPIIENGRWRIVTANPGLINGKYTRYALFEAVARDGADKIAPSGANDAGTRKVTSRVTWGTKQHDLVTYITDFQTSLVGLAEEKIVFYEDAPTDTNLANFPSNNAGDGDPAQQFTTPPTPSDITKVELLLRRTTATPSDVYVEIRTDPNNGAALATSTLITGPTIPNAALTWIEFRFPDPVALATSTQYYLRLRSVPASTVAGSNSAGIIDWAYRQTSAPGPYTGGEARRYIGSALYPDGAVLSAYDFGFRVYALK